MLVLPRRGRPRSPLPTEKDCLCRGGPTKVGPYGRAAANSRPPRSRKPPVGAIRIPKPLANANRPHWGLSSLCEPALSVGQNLLLSYECKKLRFRRSRTRIISFVRRKVRSCEFQSFRNSHDRTFSCTRTLSRLQRLARSHFSLHGRRKSKFGRSLSSMHFGSWC